MLGWCRPDMWSVHPVQIPHTIACCALLQCIPSCSTCRAGCQQSCHKAEVSSSIHILSLEFLPVVFF
jgi:hypothetical protein